MRCVTWESKYEIWDVLDEIWHIRHKRWDIKGNIKDETWAKREKKLERLKTDKWWEVRMLLDANASQQKACERRTVFGIMMFWWFEVTSKAKR